MEDFPKTLLMLIFQIFQVFLISHPSFIPTLGGRDDNSLADGKFGLDPDVMIKNTIVEMAKGSINSFLSMFTWKRRLPSRRNSQHSPRISLIKKKEEFLYN